MIQIYVRLTVKDFGLLEQFEQQAVAVMGQYNGSVIAAFETVHNADDTGEEIHILEFPSADDFAAYRQDTTMAELSALREQAIAGTEVKVSLKLKVMHQTR